MASLDLTFSEIYNQVSDFLATGTSPSGTDLTRVKNIVYRAYRQFLNPIDPYSKRKHIWSFLRTYKDIPLVADKYKYNLPLDFSLLDGQVQYEADSSYAPLEKISPDEILARNGITTVTSYPVHYAIVPKTNTNEIGTTWEIWFWPTPDGAYTVRIPYILSPDKPSGTGDYIIGGPMAGEVILEMSLAIAESQEENSAGVHAELAEKLLTQLMLSDTISVPDTLGKVRLNNEVEMARRGFVRYGTDDVYAADA